MRFRPQGSSYGPEPPHASGSEVSVGWVVPIHRLYAQLSHFLAYDASVWIVGIVYDCDSDRLASTDGKGRLQ